MERQIKSNLKVLLLTQWDFFKQTFVHWKYLRNADGICDSFVPIAFSLITLIILKSVVTKTINKKEVYMRQVIRFEHTIKSIMISTLETIWAIGTSITASAVMIQ